MLTAERLRELLRYDPDTGEFFRLTKRRGCKGGVGAVAGTPDKDGYILICIDRVLYKAHRLAVLWMTGQWPLDVVNHLDGITHNNQWGNLQCCTRTENNRHTRLSGSNTSGVKGVSWHKQAGKWQAFITVDRVRRGLGHFAKFEDAVAAREEAEKLYGFTHIAAPK